MRIFVLVLATGAALMLAAPVFAQSSGPGAAQIGPDSGTNNSQYLQEDRSLPQAYVKKVTALSYRTLELRAEDGGKLTPEHRASLQQELDQLKREYRVRTGLRIRA
jgi:hypothetical protein